MNQNLKKSILYIEDDPNNRTLLKIILEKNNYKFYEAEDGLKGIKIAEKNNIDLILLDINMQGMNGYEIATRIKSFNKYKNKPLIAVTANSVKNSRDLALISGCDGFIKKPINISNIINQIEEFLNGKKEEVKQSKFYEILREYNIQLVSHLEKEILELQRANKDLKEIDRLKSNFISLASHEIKTPLTSIIGFVRLLLLDKTNIPSKNLKKILNEIKVNALKLEEIFNDIVTFSCLENDIQFLIKNKNISIVDIIKAIIDDFSNIFDKQKIKTVLTISKKIPLIECDIDKIYLAITHLIKNTLIDIIDHEIKFSINYPSKNIFNKYKYESNNYIEIIIEYKCKDNTTINKLNKVFDNFVDSKNIDRHEVINIDYLSKGIILYFAISKGIINKHNGYIWIEKEEKNKIKYIIVLPCESKNTVD